MPKWIAIRASASVALLGSVSTLLFAVLLAAALLLGDRTAASGPLPPALVNVIGAVSALVLAGFSVWGISTAAGIFQRRAWARVSIVIFSGMLLFFGVTGAPIMLLVPFPTGAGVSQRAADAVRQGMLGFYVLQAALGAWWLILFNRQASKRYFVAGDVESARPLSVGIIGWYLLIGGSLSALGAVLRAPFAFLGFEAGEWTAMAAYSVFAAVQIYLGASLLQLDNVARRWSIAYFVVSAANAVVLAAIPPTVRWTDALAQAYERYFYREMPQSPHPWVLAAAGVLMAAAPVWFLVRRRAAFGIKAG